MRSSSFRAPAARRALAGALAVTALTVTALLAGALPAPPVPGPRVELALVSPQDGATLSAGATVQWRVRLSVSDGDNLGLALFAVDLVQDPGNPQAVELPPGDPAPAPLSGFDRPAGFTNPAADPWGSGYGGTPVGPSGRRDLLQIGGAQNTFGVAPPCFGPQGDVCMGQDALVDAGVGQSGAGQIVATGSFHAPAAPGSYTFRLRDARANVLTQQGAPPAASQTAPARTALVAPAIAFTVQ